MSAPGPRPRVVCLGVYIVDVLGRPVTHIPDGQGGVILDEIRLTVAGTGGGTAVDLASLGAEVIAIGAVGEDLLGELLISDMARRGIDVTYMVRKPGAQTSATILPIRPNGERPALHVPGAAGLLTADDVPTEVFDGAAALHVGAPERLRAIGFDGLGAILTQARAAGARTSMDLLSPGTPKLLARIEPMLGELDYLLPNEEQLMGLAGESDLGAASRAILGRGVSCVGVTRGSSGSLVDDGAQSIELPAFDVDVVDTTGCGDAFSAGFITGTTLGWTVSESAWLGTAAAALVATGLGSDAGIVDLPSTIDFMHEHRQRLAVARAGSAEGRPK